MADVFSKKKRSEIMSSINSKSALEAEFCQSLSATIYPLGLRYRKNYRKIPGSPDIAFVNKKVAVFVDGTFWHGYKFSERAENLPKIYWRKKIENNIARDKRNRRFLRRKGWKVIRIWEHDFKAKPEACLKKVLDALKIEI